MLEPLLLQAVHTVLILGAAAMLPGCTGWLEGVLAGRPPPSPAMWIRELGRLVRKQRVTSAAVSEVTELAPALALTAAFVASNLLPSFSLGMLLAPMSDLLVIFALLAFSRIAMALLAMDSGSATAALPAMRWARLLPFYDVTLLLAVLALGLMAGSINADVIAAAQRESALLPASASALAGAALLAAAATQGSHQGGLAELSGAGLALGYAVASVQALVWIELIGAVFLPFGMAGPESGFGGWFIGLLCWFGKLAVGAGVIAAVRTYAGKLDPLAVSASLWGGAAALLAVLIVLGGARGA